MKNAHIQYIWLHNVHSHPTPFIDFTNELLFVTVHLKMQSPRFRLISESQNQHIRSMYSILIENDASCIFYGTNRFDFIKNIDTAHNIQNVHNVRRYAQNGFWNFIIHTVTNIYIYIVALSFTTTAIEYIQLYHQYYELVIIEFVI